MKQFEHTTAYYKDGTEFTSREQGYAHKKDGLVGIVDYHSDGSRDIEWADFKPSNNYELSVVKHVELHGQFKHDGGINPEIAELRHHKI